MMIRRIGLKLGAWKSTSQFRRIHRRNGDVAINDRLFKVSDEVRQALAERRPVVALESTIYTHGFPYPENVNLAASLESIVRSNGAVPATIGILDGVARVGLDSKELERLASSSETADRLLKVSRRDLSFALGNRSANGMPYNGGTTVAGTMVLAHLAGIKVFATGGLGGVHRGVADTLDISADLTELGRTPVAVVASGCKAFLDIPKTLEYLETQGVAVATFADGRDGEVEFPAFWSRDSGCKSPMTLRNEFDAACMIHAQAALYMDSGILFGNPIPTGHEIQFAKIQAVIDSALDEAIKSGASGNRATPFILAKIKDLTSGGSVKANTALVESNVRAGANIATELSRLERSQEAEARQIPSDGSEKASLSYETPSSSVSRVPNTDGLLCSSQAGKTGSVAHSSQLEANAEAHPDIFVAGMLAIDYACDHKPREGSTRQALELYTSNPAQISQDLGGVGHNIARAARLVGTNVRLCSAVGDDIDGKAALEALQDEGMDASGIAVLPKSSAKRTAKYVAVNNGSKELVVAMADMGILGNAKQHEEDIIEATLSSFWLPQLHRERASHLVIDANWPPEYLSSWLQAGRSLDAHITFEPVSNAKSAGIFQLPTGGAQHQAHITLSVFPNSAVHLTTPNQHELSSMYDTARERGLFERQDWWRVVDAFGIPSSGARAQMVHATTGDLVDKGLPQKSLQLLPYIPCITTKLGREGVLLTQIIPADDARLTSAEHAPYILSRCNNGTEKDVGVGGIYMRMFPPPEVVKDDDIISVNGVGDTFAGVLIAALAKRRREGGEGAVEDFIDIAQRASILTLKSNRAVSPGLDVLGMLI